jgi:agmatine deiminase
MYTLPAEWAPQSAIQLTFPHADSDWADLLDEVMPCFVEIAAAISRFQKVVVVCRDIVATQTLLQAANLDNIIFHALESNDTWARDHGGITVFDENGQAHILDFMFNGWGLKFAADKDNLITRQLHEKNVFHASIRYGGLVLEGGGIESDGAGTILTTTECLLSPNRNPHLSQTEVEMQLKTLFGAKRILWLNHGYLAGDDTDSHIDTLARLCSESVIAYVKCDDPSDEHYEALLAMEAELKGFVQADGTPYILATYANFLIINGAVLVPTYGLEQDAAALSIVKSVFPDREIIGINCRVLIEQHGSLHCVTMQYPEGVVQ